MLNKDFDIATRSDVEALVMAIQRSDYAEWTKHDLKLTIKKFYRWLRGNGQDPPETAWIKLTMRSCNRKLPDELLTQEDVSNLISACQNPRDRAFIAFLYETGCRIGEAASVMIRHVLPHPHGFRVVVSGKTGTRRLLVVTSAPYLTDWLNVHPDRSNPRAYLWVSSD
jgi:site-specific recombinase XerD